METTAAGLTVAPRKVVQETTTYSAIDAGFKTIGETEKAALKKLFNIAHHIAVKGRPFTGPQGAHSIGKNTQSQISIWFI